MIRASDSKESTILVLYNKKYYYTKDDFNKIMTPYIVAIYNHIYNYDTKYPEGFTSEETEEVWSRWKKAYPKMDREKFDEALIGITMTCRNKESIIYHVDIVNALT